MFNYISIFFSKPAVTRKANEDKPLEPSFSRDGDNGMSKTINGDALPKDHEIFHAIGAAEELLSYLG